MNNAGVWLLVSEYIERITVSSSATLAKCGNNSDTQRPLWPRCLNAQSFLRSNPTRPKNGSGFLPGGVLPWNSVNSGL